MNRFKERSSGRKKSSHAPYTFTKMAKIIHNHLKEEGMSLNFKGYQQTIQRYLRLQEQDLYEVYQLMTECNLWSHYLSEMEHFILSKMLELQLEKDQIDAVYHPRYPDKRLEQKWFVITQKYREFTIFHKQLSAQRTFFEKAFWHCYHLYTKGIQHLQQI